MSLVVIIDAFEDVTVAEGELTLALFLASLPRAFVDAAVGFVTVDAFSVFEAVLPVAFVDVAVRVGVFAGAVLHVVGVLAFVFTAARFGNVGAFAVSNAFDPFA